MRSTTWCFDKPGVRDPFNAAGPFLHYDVQADNQLCHPVLKYQYAIADNASEDMHEYKKQCSYMDKLLDELTLIEMGKLPEAQCPGYCEEDTIDGSLTTIELRGILELPDHWFFYDDEVLTFLDEA